MVDKFANTPSLGAPDAVLTSNPPDALSPKERFPKNNVCVPKYIDKNFFVLEPTLNTPETDGNKLPDIIIFLLISIESFIWSKVKLAFAPLIKIPEPYLKLLIHSP